MDTIYVQADPTNARRLWLTRREDLAASPLDAIGDAYPPDLLLDRPGDIGHDLKSKWPAAMSKVRTELGLQAGDAVSISVSDPSLHDYPWEMLGGPERDIDVIRLLPELDRPGSHQPPSSLRMLLALPEPLSAPVRLGLDILQRESKISLTAADAGQLAAYLTQPGYFHAVHVPVGAPCLEFAETVRRHLGRGQISLLVVHSEMDAVRLQVFLEGNIPCVLVLGTRLSPVQAASFLRAFYTVLLSARGLVEALQAGCATLEPCLRSDPILLTGRPEGQIWPLLRAKAGGDMKEEQPQIRDQAYSTAAEPMTGVFVAGNINVQGDAITTTGPVTKILHTAEGDIVHIERRSGSVQGKSVHAAGRDMVSISRSTQASDQESQRPSGSLQDRSVRSSGEDIVANSQCAEAPDQESEPRSVVCPVCGRENLVKAGYTFCMHCAAPLPRS